MSETSEPITYGTDRGNQIVARQSDAQWQVQVVDREGRVRAADPAVKDAFDRFQLAEAAASRAGNDIAAPLTTLITYAERVGLLPAGMPPEEVLDEGVLARLDRNAGLRPHVAAVREAFERKTQYDTIVENSFNHMLLEADNQVAGRGAVTPLTQVSGNDVEAQHGFPAGAHQAGHRQV